jgi:hypothetical protein
MMGNWLVFTLEEVAELVDSMWLTTLGNLREFFKLSGQLSDKSLVIVNLQSGNFAEIPLNHLLSERQFLRVWKSVTGVT